jgi:NAD(P)-dependent dehydrogenase (short-subunit alcohol dehydrogenase family)
MLPKPLTGKIAIVTGASRGIGQATAIELARRGAHVVITARTEGGLEETDDAIRDAGGTATLLPLDLMDGPAIDMLGPTVFQRFGRVDILVHAAGVLGALTPVGHITPKDWDSVVGVNMAAAWRLIRTMDPPLRHSHGHAIFITDSRAREPWAYWGAYGATKAAMEHLVLTWAHEMRTMGVTISLFDPGPTRTRLRAHAFPGEPPATVQPPEAVAPKIADLCTAETVTTP